MKINSNVSKYVTKNNDIEYVYKSGGKPTNQQYYVMDDKVKKSR